MSLTEDIERAAFIAAAEKMLASSDEPAAPTSGATMPDPATAPTTPDRSVFDSRVTAIRSSNPAMNLTEAQRLARSHAAEEGFYAPGIGTSGLEAEPINAPDEPTFAERLDATAGEALDEGDEGTDWLGAGSDQRIADKRALQDAEERRETFITGLLELNSDIDRTKAEEFAGPVERYVRKSAKSDLEQAKADVDAQFAALRAPAE